MKHAFILILLGVAFLGHNLGLWPNLFSLLSVWWPLILIAVGIAGLLAPRRSEHHCTHPREQGHV
ncbi:LiaI-LiaF-like domain-containing protein [Chitinibacter sp. ZOR0017]|uniref:LiaF transmembrane domain-containing protein n=1 Tax=Chitinibacter sp. ZOR0017 TaxID=1339254 RepID=UPI000645BC51|nr:DUF5668 domain-containing protein [Chitinibacter sp. ZOR0017]